MTYGLFLELMFQSDNQYNPDDLNGFVGCWGPDPRPRGPTGGPRDENGAWHQMCGYFLAWENLITDCSTCIKCG